MRERERGEGGGGREGREVVTRVKFSSDDSLCFAMSVSRCFSIIGDSNVQRHMNPTNCRDRPLMSSCQVVPCGRLSLLAECLRSVKAETNVCILACVTNFLTATEDSGGSVGFRIEPILIEMSAIVSAAAGASPDRAFLVSPPMYRRSPLWYRDGLPEILSKFSTVMKTLPMNVHLMSSFATPEFISDGVHLTPYSGLEFVLHLFDSAGSVLDAVLAGPSEVASMTTEATRVLEDRMMAIEQDHHRLNMGVESKTAEDSEKFDYQENLRYEDWIVVSGLKRLPEGLSPRDWQVKAKADVAEVLKILTSREIPIIVVKNNTGKGKEAPTTYNVQLEKLEDSKEVRNTFGSFFLGGANKKPEALKPISINNRVTPETLVRVSILKVLAARYLASNPGAKVKVISYEARPLLKLTPPEGAENPRVQTYDYIQAIRSLPTNFTEEEQDLILKRVSPRLLGKLRSLFTVISDDMVRKKPKPSRGAKRGASPSTGNSEKQRK